MQKMRERLIELFEELTEDEQQMVLDYMKKHPINSETPVTEATGISLEGVFM